MHYPRSSWGKKSYLQTIVPKVFPVPKIGQRTRLSPHDIEEVRALYECDPDTFYHQCGENLEMGDHVIRSPNFETYQEKLKKNHVWRAFRKFLHIEIYNVDNILIEQALQCRRTLYLENHVSSTVLCAC